MSRAELARQAATDAAAKYRDSGMSMRNLADEIVDAYLAALEGDAQPVAWQRIEHEYRPYSTDNQVAELRKRIEKFGPGAVVEILTTYGLAQPQQGAFAGSLWALAEWASTVIASPPSPKLGVAVEALRRLGSTEAFTVSRTLDRDRDDELIARIDFAREALSQLEKPGE